MVVDMKTAHAAQDAQNTRKLEVGRRSPQEAKAGRAGGAQELRNNSPPALAALGARSRTRLTAGRQAADRRR